MYSNVLIPTDGSEAAERAIEQGLAIAEAFDATVHVCFVVDLAENYPPSLATEPLVESLSAVGTEHVEAVAERAGDLPVETAVLEGTTHERILEYAESADADLVVMGTHGRRGLERYLLGSVTERVTRGLECSVLVCR